MKKILALVEGQTEETFIKVVLNPHLVSLGRYVQPKIIMTKKVKRGNHFKGGVQSFGKVRPQILRLLNDTSAAAVTTMIDYYGLPDTFPGMTGIVGGTAQERVRFLESQIASDINNCRFVPYYSLHEFESLLFSSPADIANTLTEPSKTADVQTIRDGFPTPEDINNNPMTCPSARLRQLFPGYQKPLHGSLVSKRIGLSLMRAQCSHFSQWLSQMETI